jgi:hypothetical protein
LPWSLVDVSESDCCCDCPIPLASFLGSYILAGNLEVKQWIGGGLTVMVLMILDVFKGGWHGIYVVKGLFFCIKTMMMFRILIPKSCTRDTGMFFSSRLYELHKA